MWWRKSNHLQSVRDASFRSKIVENCQKSKENEESWVKHHFSGEIQIQIKITDKFYYKNSRKIAKRHSK